MLPKVAVHTPVIPSFVCSAPKTFQPGPERKSPSCARRKYRPFLHVVVSRNRSLLPRQNTVASRQQINDIQKLPRETPDMYSD